MGHVNKLISKACPGDRGSDWGYPVHWAIGGTSLAPGSAPSCFLPSFLGLPPLAQPKGLTLYAYTERKLTTLTSERALVGNPEGILACLR